MRLELQEISVFGFRNLGNPGTRKPDRIVFDGLRKAGNPKGPDVFELLRMLRALGRRRLGSYVRKLGGMSPVRGYGLRYGPTLEIVVSTRIADERAGTADRKAVYAVDVETGAGGQPLIRRESLRTVTGKRVPDAADRGLRATVSETHSVEGGCAESALRTEDRETDVGASSPHVGVHARPLLGPEAAAVAENAVSDRFPDTPAPASADSKIL